MNIEAAKAVADAIRTSLGPRGMDKMVGAGAGRCMMMQSNAVFFGVDHCMCDSAPKVAGLCALCASHACTAQSPARRPTVSPPPSCTANKGPIEPDPALPPSAGGPGRRGGDHHQRRRYHPQQDACGAAGSQDAGRPCKEPGGCCAACLKGWFVCVCVCACVCVCLCACVCGGAGARRGLPGQNHSLRGCLCTWPGAGQVLYMPVLGM